LRAAVATPAQTQIPKDGGIVVAAEKFFDDGRTPATDVTKRWKLKGAAAKVDVLAPGLVVYRSADAKAFELVDAKQKPIAKFARTATEPPKLEAPKVKAIVATKVSQGRKQTTEVEVTLDGAVPPGAVAIVAVSAAGKPMSFGLVDPKSKLHVFAQRRCEILPDGTVEPKYQDTVTVFWVDAIGRKSPASKPIKLDGAATAIDGDE
jgi:hypothetical protein